MKRPHIVIGQEAICPDGLGRVREYDIWNIPPRWVVIDTYIKNRACKWNYCNVEILPLISSSESCPQ